MSGPVIDQDGNAQEWVAVYWRHHSRDTFEADSLEAALSFVHAAEDDGNIWAEEIRDPSGEVVMDKDAILASSYEWPDGDWRKPMRDAETRQREIGR